MALAYVIIPVVAQLYDQNQRDAVQMAQQAADKEFEQMAIQVRKTLVTRNPEPRLMPVPELEEYLPGANARGLVGLYFTADIT